MDTEIERLFMQCRAKVRYGNLWSAFTVQELVDYARIKAKRGWLLYDSGQCDNAKDDLLDAANIAIMAARKIEELVDNSTQEST